MNGSLAAMLRQQQEHCFQTYGYRRMHLWLESQGIHYDSKTVLRVMKQYAISLKSSENGNGKTLNNKHINIKTC